MALKMFMKLNQEDIVACLFKYNSMGKQFPQNCILYNIIGNMASW